VEKTGVNCPFACMQLSDMDLFQNSLEYVFQHVNAFARCLLAS